MRITTLAAACLMAAALPFTAQAGAKPAAWYNDCAASSVVLGAYLKTLEKQTGKAVPGDSRDSVEKASKIFVGLALIAYKDEGQSNGPDLVRAVSTAKGKQVIEMIKGVGIKKTGTTLTEEVMTCVSETDDAEFSNMARRLGL